MRYHSPIIVWLLFVANLCADLAAWNWMQIGSGTDYSEVAFFALLSAQLCAVCIWAGLRRRPNLWTRVLPVATAIAVSFAYGIANNNRQLEFLPYFALQAAILLGVVWVLTRTRFWQRRTGVESGWQFSVAHLLAIMTVVAVLAAMLPASNLFEDDVVVVVAFLGCTVAFAVVATCVWSFDANWLLRLAVMFTAAFGFSAVFYLWENNYMFLFALYHFLTQAVVLTAWLAWGGILPERQAADVAGS